MFKFTRHKDMTVDQIAGMFFMAAQQPGLIERCFPCGTISDIESFLHYVQVEGVEELVKIEYQGSLVGFYLLDNPIGYTSSIHMCTWGLGYELAVEMAKIALLDIHSFGRKGLMTLLPKSCNTVIKLVKAIGFSVSDDIPGSCYVEKKDDWVCGKIISIDLEKKYG